MIEDTASLPGYSIFRHEESDQAPDLSRQAVMYPSARDPIVVPLPSNWQSVGPARLLRSLSTWPKEKVETWKAVSQVAPTLTLEDLDVTERIARTNPKIIEVCREIGITDMSKVFFDAWAIGFDHCWGFERRLQQGLPYYRNSPMDNQYAHPLDFSVVVDTETEEVLAIDVRHVNGERTQVLLEEHNYLPEFIKESYDGTRLRPIDTTQPQGVSFRMQGNELFWAGYKMHVGFNYREGIVISDVRIHDQQQQRDRTLFNRISVVEMVVPYGNPDPPHQRKHAFDVGEYGSGLMTNSLNLAVIARAKSIISTQSLLRPTTSNYAFYHTFTLDGTYKLEIKLTGMLNTYCMHSSESAAPYGTEVAPRLNAHNHQHIFSLRIDPEIDGRNNSVLQSDVVPSDAPVGSQENPFGNGFYCRKTPLRTSEEGASVYCHETSRAWDIINPSSINPSAKKPVGYKIINPNWPPLLAKPGSMVCKRAAFARKSLWVVPYKDYELFPAGDYVCQSTGEEHLHNQTVVDWVARNESIENTDIVCYIQFGLTHFPRTEDFPIMPAEPVSVMLRASNFFEKNPGLWVPPSSVCVDRTSRDAFCANEGKRGCARL
ncbi:copper amine oxidase [Colletotrichum phormii]|uniref:Amine oxidase n=1 Tax=Colletotrichum phormii TaxID=359342 RepID=A0AAI9ZP56_9PEZI|nr:copper amine oxidase [Colletotrichum phormii]KAK1635585.1 copper amine oxidase [Colletotrichum phormii]